MASVTTTVLLPAGVDPFARRITVTPPAPDGETVDIPAAGPVTITALAGRPGPPGPDGDTAALQLTVTAGANLSGHRVVREVGGVAVYASAADEAGAYADLWLTLNAALATDPVTVRVLGRVVESSWQWTEGPVWLGIDGQLTQTAPSRPTSAVLRQVGTALDAHTVYFNPRPASVLAP